MSFVSHVECTVCGQHHDPKRALGVCERCGQMLAVRYDLERVKTSVTKDALRARPAAAGDVVAGFGDRLQDSHVAAPGGWELSATAALAG